MTVWHYVHFFETHLFLMTVSVSRHLLVVAATVRCCRWSCTSEHTDAEDNNQIDQYSHSKSVYQHKWYKYSLSFLALISTTETPPPELSSCLIFTSSVLHPSECDWQIYLCAPSPTTPQFLKHLHWSCEWRLTALSFLKTCDVTLWHIWTLMEEESTNARFCLICSILTALLTF